MAEQPNEVPVRLLILGAHPDDAEFRAGGLAAIYRRLGHMVKFVSMTNGNAGHHELPPSELAEVRRAELAASAAVIGAEYQVWDHADGHLQATLELRQQVIREIRTFQPDLVLTHRPCDYHPDHRAAGTVVQDASFMVTVPLIVPEVPALRRDPVVAYLADPFTRPYPLQPDVVIDVGDQVDTIVRMLACHHSQVFQWLPHHRGVLDQVPADPRQRLAWLRQWYVERGQGTADRYRQQLVRAYGAERGGTVHYVEAFEVSQYAAPLDRLARQRLFPLCW